MLYQIGEVQRQTSNVIPSTRLVGLTMTAQIRDDNVVLHCEPGDVAFEDEAGACEAMQLAQVNWLLGRWGRHYNHQNQRWAGAAAVGLVV